MSEPYRKKLIEVALPLEAINAASAREKSIRHGHPSTLHLWWARRPLAACRAVLFASIVDDPSSRPDLFPTEEDQEAERQRLFRLIEELVKWENTTNETVLDAAREEIREATDGNPPPVLDPFCGGGSIPLEAQRLGLEAHASDLNPVPVLITKALIEIPPKFAGSPPVNPESRETLAHGASWKRAQGLAEDVRYYGSWMRDKAFERIGHLYPKARLTDGREVIVIAWMWAHAVRCRNPACGITTPLITSFALSKKAGRERSFSLSVDSATTEIGFVVHDGAPQHERSVSRQGATCVRCRTGLPFAYIRSEARAGRLGERLTAIVASDEGPRIYLDPAREHEEAALGVVEPWRPQLVITDLPGHTNVVRYGLTTFGDLFTARQLCALTAFADLVSEAVTVIESTSGDETYARAVGTYLGLAVGRASDYWSALTPWVASGEFVRNTFARQALPMVWDHAEANPFSGQTGSWDSAVDWIARAIERVPAAPDAVVLQLDARAALTESFGRVVSTDPPYYDNVPYADLADYFYVWLRRALGSCSPQLFATLATPKESEMIAAPHRHGGRDQARMHFESGMREFFALLAEHSHPDFPATVFYAFRQTETTADGRRSTGWETFLQGLVDADYTVTATWPMRTERPIGIKGSMNMLASSIVLACRPRPASAKIATRREFVDALRADLPNALRDLQHGSVAPVDLAQASIGPGMAIFSRSAKVIEADGTRMTVGTALVLINQVLDEILAEQEGDFDPDTRFAIAWFEQYGLGDGPYGVAETLSKAKMVGVNGLVDAGIVESRANKVRLLSRSELDGEWDPTTDGRITVWEVTQHLVRRLEGESELATSELLRRVGGVGVAARELAYRLFAICERKGWADEARGYNALVVAWPEIERLAGSEPTQGTLV